ncbi:ABC transporter substrate-binding protein [Photobacterium galatheae]|uniref:ABC transporter substrate-binding protein n=1 Tax=Photobacterium galatheae TaxID=1654360 RepID=UPI00202CCB3E|nr:ABC transporter substrate-binding protein [Photobacterium galatheae]MCM0147258.1 ABC transporter substrate-binding protein [Photobacterium galatheae]
MRLLPMAAWLLANITLPLSFTVAAEECGHVTIAEMNWNSATLLAHLDQFILAHGYGCDADLVPGDSLSTTTSMIEKSEPDIAPEVWSNSMREALDIGVNEGRLRYAGVTLSDGGEEGFWVPAYMVAEDPSLKTLAGVKAKAALFRHPEEPGRSVMMGCPAGWACQITTEHLFDALKLKEAGFELVDPGSGAGLAASIATAYAHQAPWFGYYWAPTALLGKYKMVKVDFGSGVDAEHYQSCIVHADCLDPKPTMYPPSPVDTVVTEKFAQRAPEALAYLSKRAFTNPQMNQMLAWMEEMQADGETAANYFLMQHEPMWTQWVTLDAAKRIKQAISPR